MVSNKNKKKPRGSYTLKARARRREAVHRRITLAAVKLHESVGPAQTTMNAIAEKAGVQRATVYNHFPTDLDLANACSSHWFMENPPPDQSSWSKITDPARRTEHALLLMYEYYDHGQKMLENVLRDAPVVPAMDQIRREKWVPLLEAMVDKLAEGWNRSGKRGPIPRIRASLRVALDFFTWQKLRLSGLSNNKAAKLATVWVVSAGNQVT